MNFSMTSFLLISVPEELLMVILAYTLLRKKEIRISNILLAGIITAISFEFIRILCDNSIFSALCQLIALTIILYFMFQLKGLESLVVSLLTIIIFTTVVGTVVNIGLVLVKHNFNDYLNTFSLKLVLVIPELAIVGLLSYTIYKTKIVKLCFPINDINKYQVRKIRFLVLQMTSTLVILLINYRIFLNYNKVFVSQFDNFLVLSSVLASLFFTSLLIYNALKIFKDIKKEEQLKVQSLSMEFVQNMDYVCTLIKNGDYEEVNSLIAGFKASIGKG